MNSKEHCITSKLNSKPPYMYLINNGYNANPMKKTVVCDAYQDFIVFGTGGCFGIISTMSGSDPIIYKNGMKDNVYDVKVVSSDVFEIAVYGYNRLCLLSARKFTIK